MSRPADPGADDPRLAGLRRRYLELVRDALPAAARAGGWVVTADHCFGRVLLDTTLGACWYDVLDRGRGAPPAYRQLDADQLARAVATAEAVLAGGDAVLRPLNDASLAVRGKPTRAPRPGVSGAGSARRRRAGASGSGAAASRA